MVYDIDKNSDYSKTISQGPAVTFVWQNTSGWPVEYVSQNVVRLLGYTADEFTSGDIVYLDLIHKSDAPRVTAEVIENSEDSSIEWFRHKSYRVITKNGEVKWVDDWTRVIRNDKGEVTQYHGVIADITAQVKETETYKALYQASCDGVLILKDGRFTECNDAARKMLGFEDTDALLNAHPSQLSPPTQPCGVESHEKAERLIALCNEKGDHTFEWVHRKVNGDDFWVEVVLTRIDLNGESIIHTSWRDISVRREASEKLKQSNHRLADLVGEMSFHLSILESVANTIVITDPAGNITWVNPAFTRQTGYTFDESIGKNPRILNAGRYPKSHFEELWKTILQGSVWYGDFINRRKDGSLYYESATITPYKNSEGAITHLIAIKEDITKRRELEMVALENENKFTSIFHTAQVAIILIKKTTMEIVDINNSAEQLLGYPRGYLLGKGCGKLGCNNVKTLCNLVDLDGDVEHRESFVVTKSGRKIAVLKSIKSLTIGDEEYILESFVDQSRQKEAEYELKRTLESKQNFFSQMSHDLRTPLNSILGFSQILLKANNLELSQLDYVKIINTSGHHLLDLINTILDISKIEADEVDLIPDIYDLDVLLKEIYDLFKLRFKERDIKWAVEYDFTPVKTVINSDRKRLKQVLINLVGNALKFTKEGRVTLTVKNKGKDDHFLFTVTDTGIGIEEKYQDSIFKAFNQGQNRDHSNSTGLGLNISNKLVNLFGGTLRFSSTVGEGTSFFFEVRLKRSAGGGENGVNHHPAEDLLHLEKQDRRSSKLRVLLVDDNENNIYLLKEMLESFEVEVQTAQDGKSALKSLENQKPDIIFLDITMSGLDGRDVLMKIRERWSSGDLKVIAWTAYVLEEEVKELIDLGFNDYLSKPVSSKNLIDVIEKNLPIKFQRKREVPLKIDSAIKERLIGSASTFFLSDIEHVLSELHSSDDENSISLYNNINKFVDQMDMEGLVTFVADLPVFDIDNTGGG